jgi:hypothetical protein
VSAAEGEVQEQQILWHHIETVVAAVVAAWAGETIFR